MAKDLRHLAKVIRTKSKQIDKAANKLAIETAGAMLKHLAYNTPVDTSQALSNWQLELDDLNLSKIPAHFRGKAGSSKEESAALTLQLGLNKLRLKKPGQMIILINNQPYIKLLNDGSISKQPGGFKEAALIVGRKIANGKLRIESND